MTIQTTNPSAAAVHALPGQPGQIERVETDTTRNLSQWASELEHAFNIAKTICGTMFVPQHFRNKPEETAAAILYGDTLGMAPMIAVKTIYVVHGTPALYAQQMYAIALANGHQIERVHADNTRVEFRARRRGQQDWQKIEWTIERARLAKYTSNSKYQENPIGMLTEKCKAEAAKLVAPDALAGMNSVEEIELGDFESTIVEEAPAPAKTTRISLKPQAQKPAEQLPAPPEQVESAARAQAQESFLPVADDSTGEIFDMPAPDDEPVMSWQEELESLTGDAAGLRAFYNKASSANLPKEFLDQIATAGTAAKVSQGE